MALVRATVRVKTLKAVGAELKYILISIKAYIPKVMAVRVL